MSGIKKSISEHLRHIPVATLGPCAAYIVVSAYLFRKYPDGSTRMGMLSPNLVAGSIDTLFAVVCACLKKSWGRARRTGIRGARGLITVLLFTSPRFIVTIVLWRWWQSNADLPDTCLAEDPAIAFGPRSQLTL
jgi:hypothetical protein